MVSYVTRTVKVQPDQCTNNKELDQSPLSHSLQVTHHSCKYALTHQQFHQRLALTHQPTTNHQQTHFLTLEATFTLLYMTSKERQDFIFDTLAADEQNKI